MKKIRAWSRIPSRAFLFYLALWGCGNDKDFLGEEANPLKRIGF